MRVSRWINYQLTTVATTHSVFSNNMNPQEFAQTIKQKYPQYKNIDDATLARQMVAKYPEYKDKVDFGPQPGLGSKLLDSAGQVIAGGVKRTISTGQNIGNAVLNPVKKALNLEDVQTGVAEEKLVPETGLEKAGALAADVASFAIPGGQATKAVQATKFAKSIPTLARMATEAVTGGAVAAAQQGEVDRETRDAAILSAIFPAAGKVAGKVREKIGAETAPRVINSLIKPLKKDLSYGKNPGRGVAAEGITARSLDELEKKIGVALNARTAQLETLYESGANLRKKIDASDALTPLEEAMNKAAKQNNQALLNRLSEVEDALTTNLGQIKDETGKRIIVKSGARELKNMTLSEALKLKRDIGRITRYTGNPSDDELVNRALKDVYSNVKTKLEEAVPESKEMNERLADLLSAETATRNRDMLVQRQDLVGFTGRISSATGFISSLATANPAPMLIGLGAAGLEKALSTPRAKTAFAKWLTRASGDQKKELFQKAPWAKGLVQKMFIGED